MKFEIGSVEELRQMLFSEETIKYLEDAIVVPSIKVTKDISSEDIRKSFGIPFVTVEGFSYEYWYYNGVDEEDEDAIRILVMKIWFHNNRAKEVEFFFRYARLI